MSMGCEKGGISERNLDKERDIIFEIPRRRE
jgi:hypothetical protein